MSEVNQLPEEALQAIDVPKNFNLKNDCPFLAQVVEEANEIGEVVSADDEKALFRAYT
jgi:hypothetical protein